jgi:protein-S-isoprenylcysteine O-methyltransferase Ste14
MRWRVRVGYPVAVIFWAFAWPTLPSIFLGGAVVALGLFIRGASSGCLRKDKELATSGPYALTRNPLYLGSTFIAAGFIISGHSWWAGTLVAVYFAVFYYAVMRNEEEDLQERFGTAFDEYAVRVPFFFPRIAGVSGEPSVPAWPASTFSWAQYRRNREYRALIGSIVGLGFMFLRMWVRTWLGY